MQHLSLTAVDYVAIAVIAISAMFATFRGLVHETFAIIDWLVAGFAALKLTPRLVPFAQPYIHVAWLQWVVVGLLTFLLFFIPLSIATERIARLVRRSPIGAVDRLMGFMFGAGRGLVIVSLAYLAFASLVAEPDQPDTLVKARLYPVIRDTGLVLRSLVSGKSQGKDGKSASLTLPVDELRAAAATVAREAGAR